MRTIDLSSRARRRFGAIGAAGIVASLLASALAVQEDHDGASYLHASFGRAGEGLSDRSDVKVRGVKVGKVSAIRLTEDGRARVTLRLDPGVRAPVSSQAAVVPLSVFGPKFVDLRPGEGEGTGPFLDDGGTIAKTSDPQELTDVAAPTTRLFDAMAPQDVATIMSALGTGLNGRGRQIGGLVDDSAKLLDLGARRQDDLGALIRDGGALAGTAAEHGGQAGQIADDLNVVLPAAIGNPRQFDRMLSGLQGSTRTLDQILRANPRAPGRILDSVAPMVNVTYQYRGYLPDLISSAGLILTQLAGIARVPGPHGTLLSLVTSHFNPKYGLCDTFQGVCGPPPPARDDEPRTPKRTGGR